MIERWQFGTRSDGQLISAFRLTSDAGFQAVILNQGAILQSFRLPNGHNVAVGFEEWDSYESDTNFIGRIIGPNANRIVNAKFLIDEAAFQLSANDGAHNLHSGPNGFDAKMWDAKQTDRGLTLKLVSPDGHDGFAGTIRASLNISLDKNKLRLDMQVTTERPTPVNLTWHPYWNLSGSSRIDGHDLRVDAEHHTRLESEGEFSVKDTRHDFRKALPLGSIKLDSNYTDVKSARLISDKTEMTVTSSLPDMQIYTGDSLTYPRTGIALEPQYRPNDINLAQDSLLRPGEVYSHWIEYSFDVV